MMQAGLRWIAPTQAPAGARAMVFDVDFYAKANPNPTAPGDQRQDRGQFRGRLVVSGKTGKVIAAALVLDGKSTLRLGRNPVAPVHIDPATGAAYGLGYEAGFVFPKGGKGRVFWGDRPIRWQGVPVVEGLISRGICRKGNRV